MGISKLLRDKGFSVRQTLAGRGSALSSLRSLRVQPMVQKLNMLSVVDSTSMNIVGKRSRLPTVSSF